MLLKVLVCIFYNKFINISTYFSTQIVFISIYMSNFVCLRIISTFLYVFSLFILILLSHFCTKIPTCIPTKKEKAHLIFSGLFYCFYVYILFTVFKRFDL